MQREQRVLLLKKLLAERILLLDGAMGTMIQGYRLAEDDYRGERFRDWERDLKGNNDLLSITRPELIQRHSPAVSRSRRGHHRNQHLQLQRAVNGRLRNGGAGLRSEPRGGAHRARNARTSSRRQCGEPKFVAGVLGPSNRTASISPDVNDPGYRNISFELLAETYQAAATALIDGGVDFLMVETIFDTLNAKAAIFAIRRSSRRRVSSCRS